jgi:hypothetical protein
MIMTYNNSNTTEENNNTVQSSHSHCLHGDTYILGEEDPLVDHPVAGEGEIGREEPLLLPLFRSAHCTMVQIGGKNKTGKVKEPFHGYSQKAFLEHKKLNLSVN